MDTYKDGIPIWVCVSCKYLKYSLNIATWCGFVETTESRIKIISKYGRCDKWQQCSENEWKNRNI